MKLAIVKETVVCYYQLYSLLTTAGEEYFHTYILLALWACLARSLLACKGFTKTTTS